MKKSLKITTSIIIIELIFVVSLYLIFSLLNWDFVTKNWHTASIFCFGGFSIICFIPSFLISEYGGLS